MPTTAVATTVATAIPEGFVARGPLHRVLVRTEADAFTALAQRGAVLNQEDYGSFKLLLVDDRLSGGVAGLRALDLEIVDELTLVNLNGYELDGARPLETRAQIEALPAELRAPSVPPADGELRLRLVQFIGPIKDTRLDRLRATGAELITYVANDAYVVRTDALADAALTELSSQAFVLSLASYEPAFKLRPELRPPFLLETEAYKVTVQVIASADGERFADSLAGRAPIPCSATGTSGSSSMAPTCSS